MKEMSIGEGIMYAGIALAIAFVMGVTIFASIVVTAIFLEEAFQCDVQCDMTEEGEWDITSCTKNGEPVECEYIKDKLLENFGEEHCSGMGENRTCWRQFK